MSGCVEFQEVLCCHQQNADVIMLICYADMLTWQCCYTLKNKKNAVQDLLLTRLFLKLLSLLSTSSTVSFHYSWCLFWENWAELKGVPLQGNLPERHLVPPPGDGSAQLGSTWVTKYKSRCSGVLGMKKSLFFQLKISVPSKLQWSCYFKENSFRSLLWGSQDDYIHGGISINVPVNFHGNPSDSFWGVYSEDHQNQKSLSSLDNEWM